MTWKTTAGISRRMAILRWKIYKLFMRLALGRGAGWGMDRNMVYSIASGCSDPVVNSRVLSQRRMTDSRIEEMAYPAEFPEEFQRKMAVPPRYSYRLKDVALSTETGAVWIPDERVFVESLGNIVHFYAWGGLIDVLRKPRRMESDRPVVACANLGYYHWLLDSMAQVLLAREMTEGGIDVAVSGTARRYVREGLAFFGIPRERQILCEGPIAVRESVLVSRNPDLALIPLDNIRVLQTAIRARVRVPERCVRKIYISRKLEPNRAIANEEAVEQLVRQHGFEVCYFEKMSFADQMQTMAEARVVMGVHGAGLSNIIAGSPGLTVIELLNPAWFNPCFSYLALQLGFGYRYVMLDRTGAGIAMDLDKLKRILADC